MDFPVEIGNKEKGIAADIGLHPEDVEEHFTHGGGPGGQNVNKATNCVELTHVPTGITVRYQHHRGLHQNRKEAWELLVLKVEEYKKGEESALARKRFKVRKQKQRRSRRAKEKILDDKKQRGDLKESRRTIL